ncbi:MAG: glycosyltransferase family 2 protein [Bacteroidales bacterium]|nr:glycosyltransferase family 2 protein [Bacteroidales bacterium]
MKKKNTNLHITNTKTDKIFVSIVMPVYNASATVSSAIKSILAQKFTNWELLALDDGSTDNSTEIISSFNDPRVRLIICEHNFIATLNRGFAEATGKYIARMDADDLMIPERLMIQVAIMEKRKDIDVCSSWMETFGKDIANKVIGDLHGEIKEPILKLLKDNFIFHSTVMIRRNFWIHHKIQYMNYSLAEDYKLWFEMAKINARFYIEAQPLLYYRISKEQVSKSHHLEQKKTSEEIRWEIIEYLIAQIKDLDQLLQLYTLERSLVEKQILPSEIAIQQFYLIINNILQKN